MSPPASRRHLWLALALASLAAIRVWVFALAFPFFTNVDEYRHVDAVLKYARGAGPAAGPVAYEPETARLLGVVGSPEYHRHPTDPVQREVPEPVWRAGSQVARSRIATMEDFLRPLHSLEAGQPPVYYATAGAWLALGRALRLHDAELLYWVRGLAGFAAFALVFATGWVLRRIYPERPFVHWGVPLLVAVVPQDALYYITGDAFSPLLGGLAFLGIAWLVAWPGVSRGHYLAVGVVLATGFLGKYPNAALFVSAAAAMLMTPFTARATRRGWTLLWAAACTPPILWLARNVALGAGITGTAYKAEKLGWTRKPLADWWDHPLFTLDGAAMFLHDLVASFWRGELVWHQRFVASEFADTVYVATTALALGLVIAALVTRGRPGAERRIEACAAVAVAAGVVVLALLSLAFVFAGTVHPSPAYPYFSNGRLIGGVLVAFCLLVVRGIEQGASFAPAWLRVRLGWAVLIGVVAVVLGSEFSLTLPVFGSAYNGFHLP